MTDPTLDAIRRRLEKATKGPWVADFTPPSGAMIYAHDDKRVADVLERTAERSREQCSDNAMFIAHAPEDIAFLLHEVERLEHDSAKFKQRATQSVERHSPAHGFGGVNADFCIQCQCLWPCDASILLDQRAQAERVAEAVKWEVYQIGKLEHDIAPITLGEPLTDGEVVMFKKVVCLIAKAVRARMQQALAATDVGQERT